jgi:hypothetical protein
LILHALRGIVHGTEFAPAVFGLDNMMRQHRRNLAMLGIKPSRVITLVA